MAYGTVNADLMTTSDGVSSSGLYGFKNRIINGAMVIDQRNAGASYSAVDGGYSLDRWKTGSWDGSSTVTGKYTVQQNAGSITPPAGFSNYLGVTSTAATSVASGAEFILQQMIEGYNMADLNWGTANAKTVTFSFWVYSSLTGTFGGSLLNSGVSYSYPFSYSIPTANTWTKINITVTGPTSGTWLTTNAIGIRVYFALGIGSSLSGTANTWSANRYESVTGAVNVVATNGATLYITGVQFEVGSTATSFDYRPYGTELILCQRYYQTYIYPAGNGIFNSTSSIARCAIGTQVQFRASPTVTLTGTLGCYDGASTGTITSFSATYSGINTMEFDATAATGTFILGRPARLYVSGSTGTINGSAEL